jgi:hydroxymethylglutaryl-CoA reductase
VSADEPLHGFRHLAPAERRRRLALRAGLDPAELEAALATGGLDEAGADRMVENAVGTLALPFGLALHVRVDGRDHVVPMVVEEPSVIAAASSAAKRVRAGGGFRTSVDEPLMIAQVEVHDVADPAAARAALEAAADELLAAGAAAVPGVVARGGGPRSIEVRDLGDGMLVVDVLVDCRDAMGANLLNTLAEAIGPRVAELARGELGLRILSNHCDRRCVRVRAEVPYAALVSDGVVAERRVAEGRDVARRIRLASRFAERDVRRAVTHNKGIMNGVDAVVVATGNDWRAVEAAAHAYAARGGRYAPLATWTEDDERGVLVGALGLPLALGVVGGALRAHRGARLALAILGVGTAGELAAIAASVGLASNLAALRALATEGIQRGHMALHRRALGGGA